MRALADVGNLCLAGTGPGTDTMADEAAAQGHVPAPGLHTADVEPAQLRLVDKLAGPSSHPRPQTAPGLTSLAYMLHEHTVVGTGPQGWQVAKVGPQAAAGMGSGEVAQA